MRRQDRRVEADVAAQIEPIGDMVQVGQNLRLGGETFLPVPFLEQRLRERIAVRVAFGVEAGAGVAVPVPDAADVTGEIVGTNVEPELAEPVQSAEARDAGAYHDGVEPVGSGRRRCGHCGAHGVAPVRATAAGAARRNGSFTPSVAVCKDAVDPPCYAASRPGGKQLATSSYGHTISSPRPA